MPTTDHLPGMPVKKHSRTLGKHHKLLAVGVLKDYGAHEGLISMTNQGLAEIIGTTDSMADYIVRQLIEDELVRVEGKGRARQLQLTEAGVKMAFGR